MKQKTFLHLLQQQEKVKQRRARMTQMLNIGLSRTTHNADRSITKLNNTTWCPIHSHMKKNRQNTEEEKDEEETERAFRG